jgi:hypothetical protein
MSLDHLGSRASVRALGRNHGGYQGERVDAKAVLGEIRELAERFDWTVEVFGQAGGYPLLALHRVGSRAERRSYLSAGMHGDEPAGPVAVRDLIRADCWPATAEVWICPCLNPTGLALGTRENAGGVDLNRDYRHLRTAEVQAHVAWLDRQPRFDLTLCLHEDWEARGFYLYELNPRPGPSRAGR